ncbi:hypothetical protein D9619_011225 [Psilocybe cf. subviscida]|uniref:DUF6534 domain-containing protein n=1 Tax=Psilocybe cf. subviscida TaxID=2480587 RepID=A0A8H5BJ13_9AGAR|nr:hypothetical protein D9619_011225 [Psilocybe cf. subviscida]
MILYGVRLLSFVRIPFSELKSGSQILIVQTYHYYVTFKKDVPWIKYLVLYLFIVETINTGCDIAMMYEPLIEKFGQPDATKYFPTMFAAEPIVIVAVSTPIQLFFAWRIKLLSKSNFLALVISAFSILSMVGGTWTTVMIIKLKLFALKPKLHWPALVWFLAACVSDILITVVLALSLSKRKTGFVATDDAISKIIRMTVQTGFLTAFFAVGDVIFFMTLPHTALNFIWDLALSKLYSNCLLSTLNARSSTSDNSGHHASQQRQVASSGGGCAGAGVAGNRRQQDSPSDVPAYGLQHILGSSLYDLDVQRSSSHSDIEYGVGVTITKIVETRSDPTPQVDETQ